MDENKQLCFEIQERINQLEELSETDLKTEMDDLKMVLLQNPVACTLLLPEDIGKAVAAIKRLIYDAKDKSGREKPSTARSRRTKVDLSIDLALD